MPPVYAIGDVHGQYDKLVTLLNDAQLMDADLRWTGGAAHLWFLGDFFDRGPDGIGVVELVMRLQHQAADAGGRVQGLIGNHDMLILAAYRFGQSRSLLMNFPAAPEEFPIEEVDEFTANWLLNGGVPGDLTRITHKHAAWLSHLPAMARVSDKLLIHADSALYQRCGDTLDAVNACFQHLLTQGAADAWDSALDSFGEHQAFLTSGGAQRAARLLKIFGGRQIVHGHTPIPKITRLEATGPYLYADGLCVNIDGGMYLGSAGFVYQIA